MYTEFFVLAFISFLLVLVFLLPFLFIFLESKIHLYVKRLELYRLICKRDSLISKGKDLHTIDFKIKKVSFYLNFFDVREKK